MAWSYRSCLNRLEVSCASLVCAVICVRMSVCAVTDLVFCVSVIRSVWVHTFAPVCRYLELRMLKVPSEVWLTDSMREPVSGDGIISLTLTSLHCPELTAPQ